MCRRKGRKSMELVVGGLIATVFKGDNGRRSIKVFV